MTTDTARLESPSLPTFADVLVPPHPERGVVRAAALVVGGALLTAAAAQLSVRMPWTDVPYTGQTAAVLLVGVALGWRLGLASMLLYVLAGVAGVPVFNAGAAGVHQLLGVTGGYLLGFVLAAAAVGMLAERGWDRSRLRSGGLMIAGNLIIYAVGVPVLAAVAGLPLDRALAAGALVFLPWDALKIALAAFALPAAWRLIERG
ncbi:MAG TPA: biotin transporter BioY [Candidatus Limnocylindria bacterium]|nr:biotin transporter BioY [Candidatus Limnocylindria bacterium]